MSRGGKIAAGIVLGIMAVSLISRLGGGGGNYSPTTGASGPVTYSVTGTARRASLTYQNDTGGTEQHTVSIPWSNSYFGFGLGDFVYVSAQNEGETGTLLCEIKSGGQVVYSGSASGAYSICTASGRYGG